MSTQAVKAYSNAYNLTSALSIISSLSSLSTSANNSLIIYNALLKATSLY